jgi:ATP-dependent exoDNAse (exonuclease V) alpha subunit
MTVHKAQGITVPRAVPNISSRDFASGLTYVAVSRVKTLDGLLFEEPFDFERFRRTQTSLAMRMRKHDAERRAEEHVFVIPMLL